MIKINFKPRWLLKSCAALLLSMSGSHLYSQTIVAVEDKINVTLNQSISFEPLKNDEIDNGVSVGISIVTIPKSGNASVNNETNELSYNPSNNFEGRDTLTYETCDLDNPSICSQAKIIYSVGKVPLKPTAANDGPVKLGQNTSKTIQVTTNDVLTTAGKMQVVLNTSSTIGTAVLNTTFGEIAYTAKTGYVGKDTIYYALVDTFTFAQVGRVSMSDTAFLAIEVNAIHSSAKVIGDTIFLPQATIKTQNILANNIDLENDALFPTGYNAAKLTYNSSDQTFTYKPAAGFTGIDKLGYQVCDDLNQCVQDSITIVVIPATVNNPPVITANPVRDTIRFGETGTVQLFATDKQDLIISTFTGINFVTITNTSTPNVLSFNYKVNSSAAKNTLDTISVSVCETVATTSCATATVILHLIDPTKKPIAKDDSKSLREDETVIVEVYKNDTFNKGKVTSYTLPKNGSLDTTGAKFTYTPKEGYYGLDSATYTICYDSCATATVRFNISPVFHPKVVQGVSPNNDGVNDVFTIEDVDYKLLTVSVKIYNRWGTGVYSEDHYDANNPEKSWDGQAFNVEEVTDGTYFYVVEIPELKFKDSGYLVYISNK